MHMTFAGWSRITRREDKPTVLARPLAHGMNLCPDSGLNRRSAREQHAQQRREPERPTASGL
jgi:hypothetical protein